MKRIALVYALALMAAFLPSRHFAFGELLTFEKGDGTASSPFLINTADELRSIEDAPDAYYRLADDIDLFGERWVPLCFDAAFVGVLDGAGKRVSGLVATSGDYLGLFARVGAGARIKDLTLEGCVVVGKETKAAGGLAGKFSGVATGVVSRVTLSVDSLCGAMTSVGGIVGYSDGYVAYSKFEGEIIDAASTASPRGAIVGQAGVLSVERSPLPTLSTAHSGFAATGGVGDTSEDNTLRNIVKSLRYRPDVIEVDVRRVKGRDLVISHNDPKEMNVPTLESVFKILMGQLPSELIDEEYDAEFAKGVKIQLDAKQDGLFKDELELMDKVGFPYDRVIMAGDSRYETVVDNIELIRAAVEKGMEFWMNPNMIDSYESMGAKSDAFLERIRALGLPSFTVNSYYGAITPDVEGWLRANHLDVSMWTLNSDEAIKECILRDVHNVTSRLPDMIYARDELRVRGVFRNTFDARTYCEIGKESRE